MTLIILSKEGLGAHGGFISLGNYEITSEWENKLCVVESKSIKILSWGINKGFVNLSFVRFNKINRMWQILLNNLDCL